MNQILSVEMPNNKARQKNNGNGKASTKSVLIVFSIILLIFGIIMAIMGIIGTINNASFSNLVAPTVDDSAKPRIDITQNASQLNIDISAQNNIESVEYRWNEEEVQKVETNGEKEINETIQIPSGTNKFNIVVTDEKGVTSNYTNEYVGPRQPSVGLTIEDDGKNKIKIICEEEETIKSMSYFYDNEQETKKEINNTRGEIEADIKQGEHDLTVMVEYENGVTGSITKKIYIPVIQVSSGNGRQFAVNITDKNKITKVKINFNGNESEETVDNATYTKTFDLQDPIGVGNNRLILTVYNSTNGIVTQRIWDKNN